MTTPRFVQINRVRGQTFRSRFRIGRGPTFAIFNTPLRAFDVLSGVLFPMQARRYARPLLADFSHAFAQVGVRSNVQMACPVRAMPQAWLALVGRPAAQNAAPPMHRRPVPSGRGKVQGKIEGSGTLPAHKRVCTWGWRDTRYLAAPCREVCQSLAGIGETACMARFGRMALAGVSA